MMLFGSETIREEINKQGELIRNQLDDIKNYLPYQSELEKKYNRLIDICADLNKQKKELESLLLSLQETNEKLIEYIENIEEVKQSGGIKLEIHTSISENCEPVEYEIKTIPGLKLTRIKTKEGRSSE